MSAIKAKLVDLGAYVDDELPDYIMVMVANKKTAAQMTDDLSLFLGANTVKFTTWLSGLLEKLQTIGSKDGKPSEEAIQEIKEEASDKKEEMKKKEEEQQDEDLIKISTEDVAEFDDEGEGDGPAVKRKRKVSSSVSTKVDERPISTASRLRKIARNRSSPPRRKVNTSPSKPRIGSTVGAVLKHDVYSDEEEYDPRKPSIGKVASVVKVTERKSSVPAALQANRALLLKAVTEAQSSVEKAEKASKRPAGNSKREGVHSRLGHSVRSGSRVKRLSSPPRSRHTDRERERRHVSSIPKSDASRKDEILKQLKKEALESRKPSKKSVSEDITDDEIIHLNAPEDTRSILCSNLDDTFKDDISMTSEFDDIGSALHSTNRASSPKFVVTLDNVEKELLEKDLTSDQESMIGEENAETQGENQTTADGEQAQGEGGEDKLEKCRFYPSCKNGDECPFFHPTTPCSNFPNCRYGSKCHYLHPKCRFDATCTRPTCPFTHSSNRPRAFPLAPPTVIVQPIKVPVFPSQPKMPPPPANKHPSQITCKFYPKCTNMNCVFFHPRPCRFGISCNSKATCLFTHPDLPQRASLTWKPLVHTSHTEEPQAVTIPETSPVPIMSN